MEARLAAALHPVVLVGGRSRRFGSDKLRAPLADGSWMVDRPIAALREVFGRRVLLVGDCDASVAARGDGVVADGWPGEGPAGGVLTALERCGGGVFVLSGDLPRVTSASIRAVLAVAASGAWPCVLGSEGGRMQPCLGVYRGEAAAVLSRSLASGERRLGQVAAWLGAVLVEVPAGEAWNVNAPADLEGFEAG